MTAPTTACAALQLAVRLHGAGDPLQAVARELCYVVEDGVVIECRVALEFDQEAYAIVDREQLLHLYRAVRGAGSQRFAPDGPVRIEARLEPDLLPELLAAAADPESAARRLAELSDGAEPSPLLDTEAWRALTVTCEVRLPPELAGAGTLREGYATDWAVGRTAP